MKDAKPLAHRIDLTTLAAGPLAPLTALAQWCGWRWAAGNGRRMAAIVPSWQWRRIVPPAPMIPTTWCDYGSALAAAQARNVDGIAFVLTPADPFIVMSLDDCRHPRTRSIDIWAQNFLDVTCESYAEATPSGDGIRIWGLTAEGTADIDGNSRLRSTASQLPSSCPGDSRDPARHRLSARHGRGAGEYRSRDRLGAGVGRSPRGSSCRGRPSDQAGACTLAHSKPQPKPAAEVSEKPAPGPAPKPAPSAPAPPGPAAAPAASRNGVHHAARAQSSILFDLSEVTTIDLADLINDPGMRNRKICCPFHDEKTPSLHIYPDHYYCFGCGAYGDHIDWLIQIEGLDHTAAQERLTNWTDPVISQRTATGGPTLEDIEQAEKDRAYVLRWWDAAKPIKGTLAARYLSETRGIDLDLLPDNVDDVLRFHPRCVFGPGVQHPCLIALMRDACGDAPIGIQRIALTRGRPEDRPQDARACRRGEAVARGQAAGGRRGAGDGARGRHPARLSRRTVATSLGRAFGRRLEKIPASSPASSG